MREVPEQPSLAPLEEFMEREDSPRLTEIQIPIVRDEARIAALAR